MKHSGGPLDKQTAGRSKSFQSLVYVLTQLQFGQWTSFPFCLPNLNIFTCYYCAWQWDWLLYPTRRATQLKWKNGSNWKFEAHPKRSLRFKIFQECWESWLQSRINKRVWCGTDICRGATFRLKLLVKHFERLSRWTTMLQCCMTFLINYIFSLDAREATGVRCAAARDWRKGREEKRRDCRLSSYKWIRRQLIKTTPPSHLSS